MVVRERKSEVAWAGALLAVGFGMLTALAAGPLAGLAVLAFAAVLLAFGLGSAQPLALDWDGRELWVDSGRVRRPITRGGRSEVRRCTARTARGAGPAMQVWFDADGRAVLRLAEPSWDVGQLEQLRVQAGIPLVELGALAAAERRVALASGTASFDRRRRTLALGIAIAAALAYVVLVPLLS